MSTRVKGVFAAIVAGAALGVPASASAVFSGTNGQIAFISGIGEANDNTANLFIIDGPGDTFAAGDNRTPLLGNQDRHPNWSPDGTKIVFSNRVDASNADLYVHDVATGSNVNITNTGGVFEDRPAWSPDNRQIAYERLSGGQWDIMILDTKQPLSASNPRNLTSSTQFGEGKPVWSPDAEDIYYSKGTTPTSNTEDIFREKADNSQGIPDPILTGSELDYQPALSPDGFELCFSRGAFGTDAADVLTRLTNVSSTPVDVSDNTGGGSTADYNCAWSPDGTRIAFVKGTFSNGALMHTASDDSDSPTALAADTAARFDGNPDWARVQAFCKGTAASVQGTENPDVAFGFEFKDVIQLFAGGDSLRAQEGKDTACGGLGGDELKMGKGSDTAFGAKGGDRLVGGDGGDTLDGGPGNDTCKGGDGRDTFIDCEDF